MATATKNVVVSAPDLDHTAAIEARAALTEKVAQALCPSLWDDTYPEHLREGFRRLVREQATAALTVLSDPADLTRRARDEAERHWLIFDNERHVTGCHCGFPADPGDDGYGDSIVMHLLTIGAAALSAELAEAKAESERLTRLLGLRWDDLREAQRSAQNARNERDAARAEAATLRTQYRDLATYRTAHANLGLCPEGPNDEARDPDCPVCRVLAAHESGIRGRERTAFAALLDAEDDEE